MTSQHSAAGLLSRQGRPPGDVSAVLEARDPRIIRRHLGLHRGRFTLTHGPSPCRTTTRGSRSSRTISSAPVATALEAAEGKDVVLFGSTIPMSESIERRQ
jgi:hypothetical protein